MNTQHTHLSRVADRKTYGWTGCVAEADANCNGAAHGGVTYVDTCDCGATRKTESNGRHEEVGPWEAPYAGRPVYPHSGVERSYTADTATIRIGRHEAGGYVASWSAVIHLLPGTAPDIDGAGRVARHCGDRAAMSAANGHREPSRADVEGWLREIAGQMDIHGSRLQIVRCGALL